MGYSIVQVEEIDPAGPGGVVRFVGRELGVEAFGINWFELPANAAGHEHDEEDSSQEEVIVLIRGDGAYWVEGKEISGREGTCLRLDPDTTRVPVAGRPACARPLRRQLAGPRGV